LVGRHSPGAQFRARGVNERQDHREVPSGGHVRAEGALGLSTFDEREQPAEHWTVAVAELLGGLRAGVDGDQRVVAPELAPRDGDHPRERVRGFAALRLGLGDGRGRFGERALGDGFQERFASWEVHVDGRAHDARAASDLGHARLLVVAERVYRGVEDARDAAFGVRATPRPSSLCCLM
jgi:hypothetical protein